MKIGTVVKTARKLAKTYRIKDGGGFRLKDIESGDSAWLEQDDKPRGSGPAIGRCGAR